MRSDIRSISAAALTAAFIVTSLDTGASQSAAATDHMAPGYVAAQAPHPLALDPSLRDPAWSLGRIEPDAFWDVTKHAAAGLHTQAYLLYDDRYLYVAFRAEQNGVPIVAGQQTNDVGFGLDDFVGVAVDAGGDGNEVYFFETTPRGTRYEQASDNIRYFARWESATRIDKDSWNAVLVIPLSAMRLPARKQLRWRFDFVRAVAAQGEHYTWAYDPLMIDAPVGQGWPAFTDARFWPTIAVDGLSSTADAKRPSSHVALYGLATAGSDHDRFQQANGTFGIQPVRPAGADFTIPVTDTINAVGTVDPDFSNVEVDQLTIVPQEFPRQLQEYRPFFAQGANFLSPSALGFSSPTSPNNAIFYSPGVGPFDRGAKMEGTFGWQSLGILSFRGFDETTGNTFDDIAYGYKHSPPDGDFQYWLDGVSAHHSVAGDDVTTDAGVFGRDDKTGFNWGIGRTIETGSAVRYPGLAHANLSFVAIFKPNWQTAIGYNDYSPHYDPIDGLTFDSDIRGMQTFEQVNGSTSWMKNYAITFNGDRWMDRSGAVHEADTQVLLTATFNDGFSINDLGPNVGILRSYDIPAGPGCTGPIVGTSSFTGYPCYLDGRDARFNLFETAFGYKDGTSTPTSASVSFGPFGADYDQVYSLTSSRPLGRYSLGLEYDGTYERAFATGSLDSQWLRRLSVGDALGPDSNLSLSIRSINGLGGFAQGTGTDLSLGYHRRFVSGDELYVDYGTPAAFSTLHRFAVKYVLNL
jgi:hypothetical protein